MGGGRRSQNEWLEEGGQDQVSGWMGGVNGKAVMKAESADEER